MQIISKDNILNSFESNLVLSSIPSKGFIKEVFEIINKDISNFKEHIKKSDNEILEYVNKLEKPTEDTILKFREQPLQANHKKININLTIINKWLFL